MSEQGTLFDGALVGGAPADATLTDGTHVEPGRLLILSDQPLATARTYLSGGSVRPVLLTPNDRAASAVRGATAESKSLSDLAVELLEEAGWATATEVGQLQAMRRAARDTDALGEGAASLSTLGSAVRELLRAGLGRDDSKDAGIIASKELSEQTRSLIRVALRYREVLAEHRLVDPAESMWRAARPTPVPGPAAKPPPGFELAPVLVAGYPRVGLAELVFIDIAAAAGSVFVLPHGFEASKDAASMLGGRGWTVVTVTDQHATTRRSPPGSDHLGVDLARTFTATTRTAPSEPSPPEPRLTALRLPTQEDEVRFVLAKVKQLLRNGVGQREITMIARDERLYGPLVAAVAWEFDVPVKLSYSLPIRSTRLGELLAGAVITIGEGLPFETTARLLAHPLLRALDGDTWAAARASHPADAASWTEITPVAALFSWPQRASIEQFRSLLGRLFDDTGVRARLSEREERALDRLNRSLDELPQREGMPRDRFLAHLEELLAVLSVSVDPPSTRGVEFHTPLAVFGASYEHVFVLGAVEGVLPAPLTDDPLLDFFERDLIRTAGLPLENAVEASERESLSFLAGLLTARSSLTMTYPELLDNREQLASPFFTALGVAAPTEPDARPAASGPEHLLLTVQQGDGPAHHAWRVEARRESDAPPDTFDGITGVPVDVGSRLFSASQLATLGQCAFRWFAQRRLHLAEPEEAEEAVSPRLLGSIYHKTLELVTRWAWAEVAPKAPPEQTAPAGWAEATAADFRAAALAQLDTAFTAAQADVGTPTAASWPLQRREHIERLARVIRAADFILPGTQVVRLEGEFDGIWRGFAVTGYVDRVDDGPDGLVLTDYKTGKSRPLGAKNSRGEPKLDLQLPLYVETAAPAWFPEGRPVYKARYYSLNGATTIGESNSDEDELQYFVARAMAILQRGAFPVDPDEDQKVCAYCEFDAVCRRGPRLGRMRQRAEREAAEAAARAAAGVANDTAAEASAVTSTATSAESA